MPQFKTGDMWTAYTAADIFLITTNATITTRGALVMGRGIARQAKERFPGLDTALGTHVQTWKSFFGLPGDAPAHHQHTPSSNCGIRGDQEKVCFVID